MNVFFAVPFKTIETHNFMGVPVYPINSGEILREDFLEPLGISINQLSRDLSVPPNRISEIVNGKDPLPPTQL